MRCVTALTLICVLAVPLQASALGADKAAYVGGTILSYNVLNEPGEGRLDLGPRQLAFVPERRARQTEPIRIEYLSIRSLEVGQRAVRMLTLAAGPMLVVGPFGLPALGAKRRMHQLTLAYADHHGRNQVIVMALGKNVVRQALAALEARSGITVEFQDEEARKWNR